MLSSLDALTRMLLAGKLITSVQGGVVKEPM